MIPVHFKPLARSAFRLKHYARRLGRALIARGKGVVSEVHEGYLFRATHHGKHVKVTALDPLAVWLLPHWNNYGDGSAWPVNSAVRHYARDNLLPYDAPPVGALPTAKLVDYSSALGFAMHGSALTESVSGSTYYFSQGQTDWRGDYALSVTYLTDSTVLHVGPTSKTYVVATAASWRSRSGAFGAEIDYSPRFEGQMRYVFTEGYFQLWTSSSRYRFLPYNMPWNPSQSLQVTSPRIELEDQVAFEHVMLANTFVLQGPYSSSNDLSREVECGWFVGRFKAGRDGLYVERPLGAIWGQFFRASQNPDADLAALADPNQAGRWAQHNVVDLGIAESDTAAVVVVSTTRRRYNGPDSPNTNEDTTGVQVFHFDRATGSYTWHTSRKATYLEADADSTTKPHCFTLNRLAYQAIDTQGEVTDVEALACVQFDCAALIDPATIELALYPVGGVERVTGLGAGGYAPFWPKLRGYYTPWGHVDNLGYMLAPQHGVIQHLGNNLIGVIAATREAVTTGDPISWRLVTLQAQTLAFVEDRGEVAAMPYHERAILCFSVVQQETAKDPAVLAAWHYVPGNSGHKLSRDGGRTWEPLFTGVNGLPIYLGNRLRPVPIGTTL